MRGNGREMFGKDSASRLGLMERAMKGIGLTTRQAERENSLMLTEMFTMETGRRIKLQATAFTPIRTVQDTKGNGFKTISMVMEYKLGLTEANMKEDIRKARKTDKANTLGRIAAIIMEIG
jgi:hypothetical protein